MSLSDWFSLGLFGAGLMVAGAQFVISDKAKQRFGKWLIIVGFLLIAMAIVNFSISRSAHWRSSVTLTLPPSGSAEGEQKQPSAKKPINKPPSASDSEAAPDHRIQFTSSRLWTDSRKLFVRRQIHQFDEYLSGYGLIKIPEVVPLISITERRTTSFGFVTPINPPFDGRQIPVSTQRMIPLAVRWAYAAYVFDMVIGVHANPQPGRSATLQMMSLNYSVYFVGSSLNEPPVKDLGWGGALWKIRETKGRDFTDRAMLWGLKAPVEFNEDADKYLSARFQSGVEVVKNEYSEVFEVKKILKSYKPTV